jgi:hypothetical protein
MKDELVQFLALAGRFPARLTAQQTAWVLNCQPHDVPILFAAKLLKPLGNPPVNGIKMVSADELLESAKDRSWLARVTNTIHQHWRRKNARKRQTEGEHGADEHPALAA